MFISLRVKTLLLAVLLDLILSLGIGLVIFGVSEARFRESFLQQKLDLVRAIARSIDGDIHARFTDAQATRLAEYQRYLHALNKIFREQSYIRYLYTLNYDAGTDSLTYAIDAGIAARDKVWIESGAFALVVTLDDAGDLVIQYNEEEYSTGFAVDVDGASVPLSLRPAAGGTEIDLGDMALCTVVSLEPLVVATSDGRLSEARRFAEVSAPVVGRNETLQFSFTRHGESDSIPGSPFIDTPRNIARVTRIVRDGKDFAESAPVKDIYGTSISLFGLIRNGRDEAVGVVEMDVYNSGLVAFRRSIAATGAAVAGVTFVILVGVLILFAEYLLVPIRRIHATVRRVSQGRLDVSVASRRNDEMGDLARGISGMVRSLSEYMDEQRKDKELLSQLAYFDSLTGLPNRKSFYDRLGESLSLSRRTADSIRAVLFLDLDYFKDVNDSLGHPIGDLVLQEIARRIRSHVRSSDQVFRLGGDEFTVLLTALSQETDAGVVATKLIKAVASPVQMESHTIHLGLSVGIALFPRDADTPEGLVRNADTALFEAKKQRNSFCFFTPELQAQAVERMRIIDHLHRGLERGEFELFCQPIFTTAGTVSGGEALLRWNHPEKGRQYPLSFIGLAEQTGLIQPLGRWVMQEACRKLEEMAACGLTSQSLSINLSVRQLQEPGFLQAVEQLLQDVSFPHDRLHFELRESFLMESRQSMPILQALRGNGIRLVIDDFGVGYSSLSRLKDLPMHALKIDRSFMAGLTESRRDRELVKAIVAIAHELNQEVIAEGVEQPDQVEILRALGCDAMQGFVYSPPLPFQDFLRFVREHRLPRPGVPDPTLVPAA